MAKTIELRPEMGGVVLEHLRQFGNLPEKGILAGQAVDSALTDLFGQGGGVYNDLDIFRQCTTAHASKMQLRKASKTAFRGELNVAWKSDEEDNYEALHFVMDLIKTYSIASVSRRDMLNFVNCSMADGYMGNSLTTAHVIEGFDLNCTRVGVDLATGLLHWDKHYEAFRRSRQLKIVMMHTPWHTFLRLIRKAQELPDVYVDLDAAAEACVSIAHSKKLNSLLHSREVSMAFGEKLLKQAEQYQSVWSPYFELNTFEASVSGGPAATLGKLSPRGQASAEVQDQVNHQGTGCLFFASQTVEHARRKKKSQVYVKMQDILNLPTPVKKDAFAQQCVRWFGAAYVEGQATPVLATRVNEFLRAHTGFREHFIGLTLAQQYALTKRIHEVCLEVSSAHQLGDTGLLLGYLEQEATPADCRSAESVRDFLERILAREDAEFNIVPLDLPALPARWTGVQVRELLSPRALRAEGLAMQHCVGGYAYRVQANQCRILQIRTGGDRSTWSTAELVMGYDKEYNVKQHRAFRNKEPLSENVAVLEYVLGFINLDEADRLMARTLSDLRPLRHACRVLSHVQACYLRTERSLQDRTWTLRQRIAQCEIPTYEQRAYARLRKMLSQIRLRAQQTGRELTRKTHLLAYVSEKETR